MPACGIAPVTRAHTAQRQIAGPRTPRRAPAPEAAMLLFKAELIRRYGPWKNMDDVELATLEYLGWFNHRRLHTACGNIPPADYEAIHYRHQQAALTAAETK
nr:IS3 family transposase [Microbispora corallina]